MFREVFVALLIVINSVTNKNINHNKLSKGTINLANVLYFSFIVSNKEPVPIMFLLRFFHLWTL